MGNSWTKRQSPQIQGVNGDTIDRSQGQRRYWERYAKWKESHMTGRPGQRRWVKHPLKFGDSWNPRLKCWNSEVYRGWRYPEGHDRQGQLTEEGKRRHSDD